MREIILDTETTGLSPGDGHRIVEIGCLELINLIPTGRTYQQYINPERDIPPEATAVHGITNDFLSDKPVFADIADEFLSFIGESTLVIHNANFDMKFLNAELAKINYPKLKFSRTFCTMMLAREMFPGSPANLDALCRRFRVDNSNRIHHGALLDSELLADVYLELKGGRQTKLSLATAKKQQTQDTTKKTRPYREPRPFEPTQEELELHQALIQKISS
jgi:DNA polymerase III subunit epsilon